MARMKILALNTIVAFVFQEFKTNLEKRETIADLSFCLSDPLVRFKGIPWRKYSSFASSLAYENSIML